MKTETVLLAFWLSIGSAGLLTAQGEKPSALSSPPDPQREVYARLSRQIFISPDDDPESVRTPHLDQKDQVEAVVGKLRGMITERIESLLSAPNPTGTAIADSIHRLQSASLLTWGTYDLTNTPFADVFVSNGRRNLAVAYTILRGSAGIPDSQPYLDFYAQTDGKWELKGTAATDLTASTLFVRRLAAPLPGESWYLVWGKRLGDTGARLNIRLYGFDGKSVRTIWQRDDLSGGWAQVTDNSVTLEYFKQYHDAESVREILHDTPDGLK
jgi:hypothetical protein